MYTHVHIHTYTHTCVRTYIHTHTHTHGDVRYEFFALISATRFQHTIGEPKERNCSTRKIMKL